MIYLISNSSGIILLHKLFVIFKIFNVESIINSVRSIITILCLHKNSQAVNIKFLQKIRAEIQEIRTYLPMQNLCFIYIILIWGGGGNQQLL